MSLADAEYAAAEEYTKAHHEVVVERSKKIEKHYEHKHPNDSASSSDSEVSSEDENDWKKRDAGKPFSQIVCEEIIMLKWRILVLCCFLPFGSYWHYDVASSCGMGKTESIEALFASKGKDYTSEMNQALYSIYSWPNTVLAFFGGILIDNILGLRKGMMLFTTLVLVGATIFYFGVVATNYPVMLLGRFVFGLGGESLSVAQSAYVARWFRGVRGMALAFGITISFSRVGSSFNFLFSPRIAEAVNIQTAVLAGVLACAFSLLTCVMLMFLDKYGEKKGIVAPETIKMLEEGGSYFKWSDVKDLNIRFWVATAICVTVYCSIFPLVSVVKIYLEVHYGISSVEAGTISSVYQFVCAGGSTLIGALVDTTGRLCQWMILASSMFTGTHLIMFLTKLNAYAIMTIFGIAYSFLAASLWPAVPYVVAADSTGLAFGIMTACQNTGLAIYPLVSGAILDAYTPGKPHLDEWCHNYSRSDFTNDTGFPAGSLINCPNNTNAPNPEWEGFRDDSILFCITAGVGVVLGVWLYFLDVRSNPPVLSVPASERPPSPEEVAEKDKRKAARRERRKKRHAERRGETYVSPPNQEQEVTTNEKTSLLQAGNDGSINKSSYMSGEM